jgi:hypothetical protein
VSGRQRAAILVVAAPLLLATSCSEPVRFTIDLLVREPDGQRRLSSDITSLQWTLDDAERASVAFQQGIAVESPAIALGQAPHVVDVLLFVGQKTAPLAVGRADRFTVPSSSEEAPSVFFAAPATPELLVDNVPAAREGTAACDNAAGRVLVVGGANNAYQFNVGELTITDVINDFDTVGQSVACDITDESNERLIAMRGVCDGDGQGTYELVIGLGDDAPTAHDGEACDPFVRVADDVVWVAGSTFIHLYDLVTGEFLAVALLDPGLKNVRHALTNDGTLIAQGLLDGARASFAVRRSGDLLGQATAIDVDEFRAADPNGESVYFANGEIRVPIISGNDVTYQRTRIVDLDIDPVGIVVINGDDNDRANDRIVAIDADGDVQIEGEAASISTRARESLALTFGDAVLLFGGEQGHDVLVAPLLPSEIAPLPAQE